MQNIELSLDEIFAHRQSLQEQIDQDIINLKQIGQEISILSAKMTELHNNLSEKMEIKNEYEQTLCEYKMY